MSARRWVEQSGTMSHFIKGTVPSSRLCACGKHTQARCPFADGGPHGVCNDCSSAQRVKFADGTAAPRLVCHSCQRSHRSEIWEMALLDTLSGR